MPGSMQSSGSFESQTTEPSVVPDRQWQREALVAEQRSASENSFRVIQRRPSTFNSESNHGFLPEFHTLPRGPPPPPTALVYQSASPPRAPLPERLIPSQRIIPDPARV